MADVPLYGQDVLALSVTATSLFDAGDLVGFDDAKVTAADAPVKGVAKHPATEIGQSLSVLTIGTAQVIAAVTITAGQRVVSAAGGGVRPAGATPSHVIGTALIDAAAGQRVTVLIRDPGQVSPAANVVFADTTVGPIAMTITVPTGATLTGRTATWAPSDGQPAAITLGGTLSEPSYTATTSGTLTLTISWTDAGGGARSTVIGQAIRAALPVTLPVNFTLSAAGPAGEARITISGPLDPAADRITYRTTDGVDRMLITAPFPPLPFAVDTREGFTAGVSESLQVFFANGALFGPLGTAMSVIPNAPPTLLTPPSLSGADIGGAAIVFTAGTATGVPAPTGAQFAQFLQRQAGTAGAIETLTGTTGHIRLAGHRYRARAQIDTGVGPNVNYIPAFGAIAIPQALAAGDWTAVPGAQPGTIDIAVPTPPAGILADLVVSIDGGPAVSIDTVEPWLGTTTAVAGARQVRAAFRNAGSASDGSNIQWSAAKAVTVASGAVATKPAPFTDLMAEITPVGNGLRINIGSLPADGGSPLTRIDRRLRAVGTSTWGNIEPLDSAAPFTGQTDVAGISPGDYEVQLFAVNAVGTSDPGYIETVTVTAFYPAVAPVDLTVMPTSVQFPEFNGRSIGYSNSPTSTAVVSDPRAFVAQTLDFAFPASTGTAQIIVVASDPAENPPHSAAAARSLFGNVNRAGSTEQLEGTAGKLCLHLNGRKLRLKSPKSESNYINAVTTMAEAPNPVPSDFIAAATFLPTGFTVSHSEILTGVSYVSPEIAATYSAIAAGQVFNIGATGVTDETLAATARAVTAFAGKIQAVYVLIGATVSQTVINSMARGEILPQNALPIANLRFAREGLNGAFVKPAWATPANGGADTTAASVKLGATPLAAGKTLLPQTVANWVLAKRSYENKFYALLPNETVTTVTAEAIATGPVDARVFDESGAVVRDWTQLTEYNATTRAASGSFTLPIGVEGMYQTEYRLRANPTIRALGPKFAVGLIATGEGQSQMAYGMSNGPDPDLSMYDQPVPASARIFRGTGDETTGGRVATVGGNERRDFFVGFGQTWQRIMGKVPVMLIPSAVTGSGMADLLYDDDEYLKTIYARTSFRKWAEIQRRIDFFGPKYTAIFETWLSTDQTATTPGADWKARKAALYYGDQPSAMPPIQHSYATSLTPGYGVIHMPVTRGGVQGMDNADYIGEMENMLVPFALEKGQTLALPVPDMQSGANGKDDGHAKPKRPGPRRFGRAVAVGLARLIGKPTISNSYWTNPRKTARNVIAVDLVQGAGGTISISPDPLAKHPWAWSTTANRLAKNFTFNDPMVVQGVSNNGMTLTLTKTDGDWPDTVYIAMRPPGAHNIYKYSGTNDDFGTFEDQAVAGLPRETWADDPLGEGVPIVGSINANGQWTPIFETVLGPYVAPTVFATAASVESYVTTMAGRKSTAPLIPLNPEQLTGRPTGLTFADGFFTLGGSATGWIENFEFGAKIRLNNAAATGFLGFRNCVFKTTRGGGVQNTEIINAASTFRLPSVEDCLFLNENNVLGQGMAINVGRPADGSPLSIQRNRFRGFTSDVLQVPVHTIKHNWFDYTHTIPVANPAAWNAATTYAQYDLVTNNGWVFMSEVDGNVGNAPPTTETGSTSFWRPKNPHLDAISARGTIAGGEGIVQNFIDMRGDGSGVLKGINNYVRHYGLNAASYVAGPLLIKENSLRRTGADGACFGWEGDTLTDPAYATIDGNWIDPNQAGSFGPSLSTALGQERVKWGTNRNPTSNAVLTRPANAGAL